MKKMPFGLTAWAVLIACLGPFGAQAAHFDLFRGDLTIQNNTPFSLQVKRHFMESNKRGSMGTFIFSDEFKARNLSIDPGELSYLGYGESQKNEVEGHFVFGIADTDQLFDAHYRFGRNRDNDTWFGLKNFEDKGSYPFVSVHMVRSCNVKKRLISGTRYDHTCTVRLSMDDESAACIGNPNCSVQTFRKALKHKQKEEL